MSSELIVVLGGARSGKSSYAERLARELGGEDVLYVATAEARDEEMRARIAKHRAARPAGWRTLEAPLKAAERIEEVEREAAGSRVVLLDCLTLLASNALLAAGDDAPPDRAEAAVRAEVDALLAAARRSAAAWILVSNEVGLGIVPAYPLGRVYRDALGRANQRCAAEASRVYFMVAGLPMPLK
jgi:adenosylcobinamide kinase / adenosylcobinamide-phosphate guanylyltransferase